MDKIYLNIPVGVQINNIVDLLNFGFCNSSSRFFEPTYYDITCTKLQCSQARRSLEDLYAICCTYFADTKVNEVVKALNNIKYLAPFYCHDIENIVFCIRNVKNWDDCFPAGKKLPDHSGCSRTHKGKGKYCYDDIISLLNQHKQ